MSTFDFEPASFVPFRDKAALAKARSVHGKDLEKYSNDKMKVRVTKNPHPIMIADIFTRIKMSDDLDKKQVLILGNPEPETYIPVAELINYHKVDCRNVYIFAMDEWADQDGNIAPENYCSGFANSMLKYFVYQIDQKLRMPLKNVFYPTNKNIKDYSKMITDIGEGGADVCYSGPGWAGHIAFVDPSPEFLTDNIEEYLNMDARIVTLHPLTVCQNSLHGVFGQSGDIANVPPKAATIGPGDVARSRERIELHCLQTMGTFVSWQRMVSRLIILGPVTPYVPSSIFQVLNSQIYVSEEVAAPFECWETVGY